MIDRQHKLDFLNEIDFAADCGRADVKRLDEITWDYQDGHEQAWVDREYALQNFDWNQLDDDDLELAYVWFA